MTKKMNSSPPAPKPKAAPKPSAEKELKEELVRKQAALELVTVRYGALRQFVEDHYGVGVLDVFDARK